MKLYKCAICGNIAAMVHDAGPTPVCCGEKMTELVPNTTDAAQEKHVPVISVDGQKVTVCVGSAEHPMLEEHYITFIILETDQGRQRKVLSPGQAPKAEFVLSEGEKVVAAYEYCNLHGFWKGTP